VIRRRWAAARLWRPETNISELADNHLILLVQQPLDATRRGSRKQRRTKSACTKRGPAPRAFSASDSARLLAQFRWPMGAPRDSRPPHCERAAVDPSVVLHRSITAYSPAYRVDRPSARHDRLIPTGRSRRAYPTLVGSAAAIPVDGAMTGLSNRITMIEPASHFRTDVLQRILLTSRA